MADTSLEQRASVKFSVKGDPKIAEFTEMKPRRRDKCFDDIEDEGRKSPFPKKMSSKSAIRRGKLELA